MQGLGFAIVGIINRLTGTGPFSPDPEPTLEDLARLRSDIRDAMGVEDDSPYGLWRRAGGDSDEYIRLMREAGHVVDVEPCATCGERFRHRHTRAGAIQRVDPFGHDERES